MNPTNMPPDERARLEARVTALLLGETTAEEAAALRQQMSQDPALSKLHERLRLTLELVRESAATSAGQLSEQPAPLKLSPARREALLAFFKTVRPKELARPRRVRMSLIVELAAAAAAIALLVSVLVIPHLGGGSVSSVRAKMLANLHEVGTGYRLWGSDSTGAAAGKPDTNWRDASDETSEMTGLVEPSDVVTLHIGETRDDMGGKRYLEQGGPTPETAKIAKIADTRPRGGGRGATSPGATAQQRAIAGIQGRIVAPNDANSLRSQAAPALRDTPVLGNIFKNDANKDRAEYLTHSLPSDIMLVDIGANPPSTPTPSSPPKVSIYTGKPDVGVTGYAFDDNFEKYIGDSVHIAAPADNSLEINLQNATVDQVFNFLGEKAGMDIKREANTQVAGTMDFAFDTSLNREETVAQLNKALAFHDLTAVQNGKTLSIETLEDAANVAGTPVRIDTNFEVIPADEQVVTEIIPTHSLDPKQVVTGLSSQLPPGTLMSANEGGNGVTMTGTQADIRKVSQEIAGLDSAGNGDLAKIQAAYAESNNYTDHLLLNTYTMQNGDVMDIAGPISNLFADSKAPAGPATQNNALLQRMNTGAANATTTANSSVSGGGGGGYGGGGYGGGMMGGGGGSGGGTFGAVALNHPDSVAAAGLAADASPPLRGALSSPPTVAAAGSPSAQDQGDRMGGGNDKSKVGGAAAPPYQTNYGLVASGMFEFPEGAAVAATKADDDKSKVDGVTAPSYQTISGFVDTEDLWNPGTGNANPPVAVNRIGGYNGRINVDGPVANDFQTVMRDELQGSKDQFVNGIAPGTVINHGMIGAQAGTHPTFVTPQAADGKIDDVVSIDESSKRFYTEINREKMDASFAPATAADAEGFGLVSSVVHDSGRQVAVGGSFSAAATNAVYGAVGMWQLNETADASAGQAVAYDVIGGFNGIYGSNGNNAGKAFGGEMSSGAISNSLSQKEIESLFTAASAAVTNQWTMAATARNPSSLDIYVGNPTNYVTTAGSPLSGISLKGSFGPVTATNVGAVFQRENYSVGQNAGVVTITAPAKPISAQSADATKITSAQSADATKITSAQSADATKTSDDEARRRTARSTEATKTTSAQSENEAKSRTAQSADATKTKPQFMMRLSEDDARLRPATPPPAPQPEVQARENAFSTFSLNVSDVSFKLAAASLQKGLMPEPATVRSEEFINAFNYRDPEAAPGEAISFAWERAGYPFAHNRDLLRFAVKTASEGRQAGRPLNLVLALDKSGSMERADRVAIIREALRVLATELKAQDTLSVVVFARTARLLADGVPGSRAGALAAELEALTPEGGTNLEEAMRLAYEAALRHYLANGENRVVILTDGAANLGDVEPEDLKKQVEANRAQGIALDCFGVGWEDYNDTLLETLSRSGGGRYGFVNTPEEAATEFASQLAGALRVAASDVKVQVEFNTNRVISYRQIGYAKDQLKKEQFRDNTVKAAQLTVEESGNALYTVELNPEGEGPVCTVYVRYRTPGTSDYHEHAWAVPYDGTAAALDKASPAMRLAATASAFSEWLAGSPYAGEVNLGRLLGYLRGLPEFYGADARPKLLETMLREAASISGN